MKSRLRATLFIFLSTLFLLSFAGASFADEPFKDAWYYRERAEQARDRAEAAREKNDAEAERKAIDEQLENLDEYVKQSPDDLDARERYAMLLADNAPDAESFAKAFEHLEKIVEQDPDRESARKSLVRYYLLPSVHRFNDARTHLDALLKKTPDDANSLYRVGHCLIGMGKSEEAIVALRKAVEISPETVDAYWLLATTLRQTLSKPDEADAWMDKMIAANGNSALAHRQMCRYLLSIKSEPDPKGAQTHADAALKLDPDHRETLALQAACCLANKNYYVARRFADKALESEKDDLAYRQRMYLLLADVENALNDGKQAVAILQKAYDESKNPELLWTMADWQLSALDLNGATATIEKLKSLDYPDVGLDYLRGKMLITQSRWREGCDALERARPFCVESPDRSSRLEYFLGLGYGNLGNSDKQIEAFRRALEIDPQFAPARQALMEALGKAGKKDDALREAAEAAKSSKDPRTLLALIGLRIEKQRRLPKAERQWDEIDKLLDDGVKDFPDLPPLALYRCDVLAARDRFDEVEKLLMELLEKNPQNRQYWSALARTHVMRKQWSKAEEMLTQFEKTAGDSVELRLTKAHCLALQLGPAAAPKLRSLRENVERFDDAQKAALWSGLMPYAAMSGDRGEARTLLELSIENDPRNLQLQSMRFDQASADGDLSGMEKILDNIERIEGQGPIWLREKAVLLSTKAAAGGDRAGLDEALRLLDQAKELRPTWAKIPLIEGYVHDQKGETGEALAAYLKAIELGDSSHLAVRRAMQLLYEQKRYKEADELLERLERAGISSSPGNENAPVSPELAKWSVELLMQQDRFEQAVEKARKLFDAESKDPQEPLWFGRVYWNAVRRMKDSGREKDSGEYVLEAEKHLRRAAELGGGNPEPWTVLVVFLSSVGKTPEAANAAEDAKRAFAGREPLALGRCYEVLKDYAQANKHFEEALAAKPRDPEVLRTAAEYCYRLGKNDQAELLLTRLLENESLKPNDPEAMKARRLLAIVIASRKGYENAARARELIAKNLAADPHSAIDNRMLADCDARDPEHGRRREAIEALAKLQKNGQASLDERWNLAKLYLADKQWKNARETYRMLVAAAPERLEFAVAFALALLDHDELAEAEPILRLFEEKYPKSIQAALLTAEMLLRRGKADEAIELLKRFVEDSASTPADRGERMKLAAMAIEDFVKRAKPPEKIAKERLLPAAEAYWRQLMSLRPEAVVDLLFYYARQKQLDDAAELLEKSWQSLHPAALARVCHEMAQQGRDSKPTVDRVIAVLDKSRSHFRHHPALVLALGNIHSGRGEYDAAEECFRDVLRANPRDPAAMNNLASTLASAKRNLDEALELIEKAMKITGPLPAMLDTRACIRIARGEGEKAVADMADVVADAKTGERLFHQAQAYEAAGEKIKAGKSMKEALEKGLSRETLSAGEIPIFDRLKKLADDLPPEPEDDGPSFFNDYA
jgi:tetratricopeptide (TPR) repeat protein